MDNPTIAKAARIMALRDQQLFQNNKINFDLKACLKKAKAIEQKQQTKLDKTCQKAQEKAQLIIIRRLAISNCQINAF